MDPQNNSTGDCNSSVPPILAGEPHESDANHQDLYDLDVNCLAASEWRRRDAQLQWILLALSLIVILAAAALTVRSRQEVIVPFIDVPVPELCSFRRLFGVDCPGCGLTRSFISVAHLDLPGAWRFNPVGILLFVLLVGQIPYRIVQLRRIRLGLEPIDATRSGATALAIVAGILFIRWISRAM